MRAQRKLFRLARRDGRTTTVTLDEAEISALLSRHLVGAHGVGPETSTARLLGDDRLQLVTRMPLRHLLDAVGAGGLSHMIPAGWLALPSGFASAHTSTSTTVSDTSYVWTSTTSRSAASVSRRRHYVR